jgi:hypothetical protein
MVMVKFSLKGSAFKRIIDQQANEVNRVAKLSPERRREIAKNAAKARWAK